MTAQNTLRKKGHAAKVILVVLGVMASAIIALVISLVVSGTHANDLLSEAKSYLEQARTDINEGNITGAINDARKGIYNVNEISKELSGSQWSIASAIPIVGTDAQALRDLVDISKDLCNEGVLPIIDLLDQLPLEFFESGGTNNGTNSFSSADRDKEDPIESLTQTLDTLSKFPNTLSHSAEVVRDCERRSNSLPDSHFDVLNQSSEQMKEMLDTACQLIEDIEGLVDSIGSLMASFS